MKPLDTLRRLLGLFVALIAALTLLYCTGCAENEEPRALADETEPGANAQDADAKEEPDAEADKAEPDTNAEDADAKEKPDADKDKAEPAGDAKTDKDDKGKTEKQKPPPRPTHKHAAFKERAAERGRMVASQIALRRIKDAKVLAALRTVPRHAFVRFGNLKRAYGDHPLPIGFGQTISQPYIVGYMTEALKLKPEHKVLEVGTGSGYQAAVCAEIARDVYTIEILVQLGKQAKKRLKDLGYPNVHVKVADGFFGWPDKGPFDAIIVTCAGGFVPPPLIKQLKPGGRMIIPLGHPFGVQYLVLITKDDKGKVTTRRLLPVRFVPLVRKHKDSKTTTDGKD